MMAIALGGLTWMLSPQSSSYTAISGVLVAAIGAWLVWQARHPLRGAAGRVLSDDRMVYLGKISYGVYLYHMVTPALVDALGMTRWPLAWRLFEAGSLHGFAVHCAITIALAGLSFRYFETPIRKLAGRGRVSGGEGRIRTDGTV